MEKINELIRKYHNIRYPIGSDSFEWFDIKSDFEIKDEILVNEVFQKEKGNFDGAKIQESVKNMESYKERIISYKPINSEEEKEKELLIQKVNMGLEIYSLLLTSSNS